MFNKALQTAAQEYQIELTEKQRYRFQRYHELLLEWNEKMNLTAITDPEEVAVKHMIDSLSCYDPEIYPHCSSVIDVGTGAGFPGLPLKIWREEIELTLLDSLNKRVNFLNAVKEALSLEGTHTVHGRAEDVGRQERYREQYDIAVSRAVARLCVLCELCMPFVRVGGYFIALKGSKYLQEIDEAKRAITLVGGRLEKIVPIKLPGINDVRAVIYIKKIKKVSKLYPRKAGIPEKSPL